MPPVDAAFARLTIGGGVCPYLSVGTEEVVLLGLKLPQVYEECQIQPESGHTYFPSHAIGPGQFGQHSLGGQLGVGGNCRCGLEWDRLSPKLAAAAELRSDI